MLDQNGVRQLSYVARITQVRPIEGADNIELVQINRGWWCIAKIGEFVTGDLCVYFEIDSKLPEKDWSEFLAAKHYKVKTMKLGKFKVVSQGLALPVSAFGWEYSDDQFAGGQGVIDTHSTKEERYLTEGDFLTKRLGVTYSVVEDNERKSNGNPDVKINAALARHPKFAKRYGKVVKKNKLLRWFFTLIWGKKKDSATAFPKKFPYIRKTDQERCENMVWVLKDKTPYIVTQKCDGSSGTYILERKPFGKFEFYVCSRNVRQLTPDQQSYYDENYYWECAIKYDIENKLKDYLIEHPDLQYVCWQGEICAPKIQGNPQKLTETHLFLFHMIDSKIGKYNILDAAKIWTKYNMEVVPIVNENYILPDNFDDFKLSAEGNYDPSVCEGNNNCPREGYVYYKTTDPNFSFKNVSKQYLLKN